MELCGTWGARGPDRGRARGRGRAPPGPGGGRQARLREPLPRAHVAPRRAAHGGRGGRPVRHQHAPRGRAGEPRVRVGKPHRAAARRRRALGRRGRRDREPARVRRAPSCTASTTSTTPATSSRRSATRCTRAIRGENPPDEGYQGHYLVDLADELRASSATTSLPKTRASGA